MRILRVFPRRTSHTPKDNIAFVGDPPLDRPEADEVHVSCTFTWDKPVAERLKLAWGQYYPVVKLGGPAFDDPGDGFTPGMYLREGIITTSRGCNNNCPWCFVPEREGKIRELPVTSGNIIQDNNLLQCSPAHIDRVFDMLQSQSRIEFTGGLDARLINSRIADRIRSLKVEQMFLACDTEDAIKPLRKALKLLQISRHKARCYVLLKFDAEETMVHALARLLQVWDAGAKPSAQLYQPKDRFIEYPPEWLRFQRIFERPAATHGYINKILEEVEG